ncbi:mitochondrial protein [Cyathus striatus]|nr:mitochondrial protein [Cyathus striatus]
MDDDPPILPPPLSPPLHNSSAPRDKEPEDIQKILKWQEDRLKRRLRGEYESATMHLTELINDNLHTHVNIAAVRVEGATHTRSSFLASLIDPVLASNKAAYTDLESVLHTTRRISQLLKKSDIFSAVEVRIERSPDPYASLGDVDLVFKTKERGRLYLNSSTEVGNQEGSASVTARVRNVFGGAETFEANVAAGTKTRRAFRANLTAPLTSNLSTTGDISIFGLERDNSSYASSTEGIRGLKAAVRVNGVHEFAYEAIARNIGALTPTASLSIREAAGKTIKSSLSHTYIFDTRNDRIAATRGFYTKFYHEYAGLGGDASFYKAEFEGQVSRPVTSHISWSLAAKAGLLYGINKPTLLPDRFQLGGPTSIRSFRQNSMGPRDDADSLGGDVYYSVGASVISHIPSKEHWPVKLHGWVNAGRLDAIDRCTSPVPLLSSPPFFPNSSPPARPITDSLRRTLTQPSISAGVGLIYRFDPIRVEVNFGLPIVASKSDGGRKGVQVGMGLEFL